MNRQMTMSPTPKPLPPGLPAALVRRTAGAAALVLALAGAFAAGRAFNGQDTRINQPVQLKAQGLGTGRSCADLRSWYVAHALDEVTAWGWQGPVVYDAVGGA